MGGWREHRRHCYQMMLLVLAWSCDIVLEVQMALCNDWIDGRLSQIAHIARVHLGMLCQQLSYLSTFRRISVECNEW
jgi:hypothetical protein